MGNKFQCNSYKLKDLIVHKNKKYGREYKQCLGSQFQPCIGADGEVYVCTSHRGHKERSYGNLKDKSFSEIWSDMNKRSCVMKQIEDKEKFSMCSQLCKPHESNKIIWEIKKNLHRSDIIKKSKRKNYKNSRQSITQEFYLTLMRVVIFGSTGLLGQSIKSYLALKNYKCFGSSLKKNSDFKSDLQSDKKIIQF